MSSKRDTKKQKKKNDEFEYIKKVVGSNLISKKEIEDLIEIDYPLFSFKYLQKISIEDCKDYCFFQEFLFRLQKLSDLGWNKIRESNRHSFGMEKIPYKQIIHKKLLPDFVTPDAELCVFRATGSNLPFIGIQNGKLFHIIFVETKFGDIYNHGSK